MKHKTIFKMIYCSIMAAMSFVCTFFEIPLVINITLYGIPLIFVGIVCGPLYGLLTGLLAGVLEQLKWGLSLQTFLWLLAPMSWGGISGLLFLLFKKILGENKTFKKIIIYCLSIIIAAIFANLFNTTALVLLGMTGDKVTNFGLFITYALSRMISIPIHVIIYVPVCYIVCESFKKIKFIN